MKLIVILTYCLFTNIVFTISQTKMSYHIEGELIGLNNNKIYLTNKTNGIFDGFKVIYFDSCFARNNKFSFSGSFYETAFYSIETGNGMWRSFLIDSNKISIKGKLDSIYKSEVKGSVEHDLLIACYLEYEKENAIFANYYSSKMDSLRKIKDTLGQKKYIDSLTSNSKKLTLNRKSAILKYRNSYVALLLIDKIRSSPFVSKDTLHNYFNLLPDRLKLTSLGIKLYDYFNNKKLELNETIDSMYLMDSNLNLSYIKMRYQNYKLLNFWANWCIPCIEKIPDLKKLITSLSPRVEMFNISLDLNEQVWKGSLIKYDLNWNNYLDFKRIYDIPSIPRMILVDRQNKILLENTNIQELKEYFKVN